MTVTRGTRQSANDTPADEGLITAAAVGKLLGLSTRTIYDLAASRALPSYRFGDAVRFARADLEAYKAACRVVAQQIPARSLTRSPIPVASRGHPALSAYDRALKSLDLRIKRPGAVP